MGDKNFIIDNFNQYKLDPSSKISICPLCSEKRKTENRNKKVLLLDWERGLGTCQHCGTVVQLHTYKRDYAPTKQYSKPHKKPIYHLSENVINWFETRKISLSTLKKARISEGNEWMPQVQKERHTIHFNYFLNDELINIKYRDGKKNFKLFKDAERVFYNIDSLRHFDHAIICEGEIDALSFIEVGVNYVVSVPNGATKGNINLDYLDSCYEFFEGKEKIFLSMDNDVAGINLKKELVRRLGAERCWIINWEDCKDANEYLVKYGKEKFIKSFNNAIPYPIENVYTALDFDKELTNFYINGAKKGFVTGMTDLDEIFSIMMGQHTVVTGIPSSGKSEVVDQMNIGYNLKYGFKIAYASPENQPIYLHIDKIATKLYGRMPKVDLKDCEDSDEYVKKYGEDSFLRTIELAGLKSKKWRDIINYVNENFFFLDFEDGWNLTSVLKKTEELVKRKGIKILVIDPFNKIMLKDADNKIETNINKYTRDYMMEIESFEKKHDIHIFLVAHPVKMRKIDGDKNVPEPSFYDVKGGGEMYDMSPSGLLVHRNYEKATTKIKVLKIKFRHMGTNNEEANFMYNVNNGRMTHITGDINRDDFSPKYDNTNWLENGIDEVELPKMNINEIKDMF